MCRLLLLAEVILAQPGESTVTLLFQRRIQHQWMRCLAHVARCFIVTDMAIDLAAVLSHTGLLQ